MNIFYSVVLLQLFLSTDTFGQQSLWRLAKGTDQVYIAAMDLYRNKDNGRDTLYAMGFTDSVDINAISKSLFLRSLDHGETWDSISNMGAGLGALKVDPSSSQIIYASHPGWDPEGNDISMSTDGGVTWSYIFHGHRFPTPVVEIDPVDHKTVYVGIGPGALWRTNDHGQNWEPTGGVPTNTLMSIAIDPMNDSILWAGTLPSIMKSTDRGTNWFSAMTPPLRAWNQIAINPKNPDIVYVSFFDTLAGVFKTTDGGINWQDANGNLAPIHRMLWRIAIDPRNPEMIFLGSSTPTFDTNEILFRSTDGGTHWAGFSDGLPNYRGHVESILIDTVMNKIFVGVGAYGRSGLYVCDCLTSVKDDKQYPSSIALYQNFPNPFNPQTRIDYSLPETKHVKLVIYDVLGREVVKLVDEVQKAGYKSVSFDASNLPSGVYLYRVTADNPSTSSGQRFTDVKKMILMK